MKLIFNKWAVSLAMLFLLSACHNSDDDKNNLVVSDFTIASQSEYTVGDQLQLDYQLTAIRLPTNCERFYRTND